MADWVTISAIASAGGTLVLAAATFASVKSANRAARVAERSLMAGLRPLLMPSKLDDPEVKVGFADDKWLKVPGGQAAVDITPQTVYMAMGLRNVGTGIAVLHGWHFFPERSYENTVPTALEDFTRLRRRSRTSPGSIATSTSRPATSASGREHSATRRHPPSPRQHRRSRHGGR